MNPEIAERWADALESGEFFQGTEALGLLKYDFEKDDYIPAGYCCLGVLCELAVQDGVIMKNPTSGYVQYGQELEGFSGRMDMSDMESGVLPHSVREWAGLGVINPIFTANIDGDDIAVSASSLNDHHGFSFREIAKLIREQHENL